MPYSRKLTWIAKNSSPNTNKDCSSNIDSNEGLVSRECLGGQGWQEKLDWVQDHYTQVMDYHNFNPSQTAKILKGKGWEQKIEWIKTQYENSGLTPSQAMKELIKKDWKERLHYAA